MIRRPSTNATIQRPQAGSHRSRRAEIVEFYRCQATKRNRRGKLEEGVSPFFILVGIYIYTREHIR
jgi:hypothetical protein